MTLATAPAGGSTVTDSATSSAATGSSRRWQRQRRRPVLAALSVAVAVLVLLPLVFLILQAGQAGWGEVRTLLFRHLTWQLLRNTVELAVLVTAACVTIGVAAAWWSSGPTCRSVACWRCSWRCRSPSPSTSTAPAGLDLPRLHGFGPPCW